MVIVSACLMGCNCKYNGGNNLSSKVAELADRESIFLVCPETSGGLPVPRPPAEIKESRVMDCNGNDVTDAFLSGSKKCFDEAAAEAKKRGESIEMAVLKARSPSCGSGLVYDGTFSGNLVPGNGVFADMLISAGIPVYSELNCTDNFKAAE